MHRLESTFEDQLKGLGVRSYDTLFISDRCRYVGLETEAKDDILEERGLHRDKTIGASVVKRKM